MKLSTLPMLLWLAGTVTWSAQSTQVTKDTLIQTIQTTGETNLDRSEKQKQAIIDSLQKVYGPFVVLDGTNYMQRDVLEKEAEANRSEKDKEENLLVIGNLVTCLDLSKWYARNRAWYCAYIGPRFANEIVAYRAISWLGSEILWAYGLDLVLAHQNTERYADTIGLEPWEHRRGYEISRDSTAVGISAEWAYNQMIDIYKQRRGKELPKGEDASTDFIKDYHFFWSNVVRAGYITDKQIDMFQRNSDPLGLFATLLGKDQCTKHDVDFFTNSYSLYSQKWFEKLWAMRLENTKK